MKTRHYTPEIKERAVRMLIEAADNYPSGVTNVGNAAQTIVPNRTL